MSCYAERSWQGLTVGTERNTRSCDSRPPPAESASKPVEGIVPIAEDVTAGFYGPGDAEALAVRCRADAGEAGFDPDEIGYQAGEDVATLIREATIKRGGAVSVRRHPDRFHLVKHA